MASDHSPIPSQTASEEAPSHPLGQAHRETPPPLEGTDEREDASPGAMLDPMFCQLAVNCVPSGIVQQDPASPATPMTSLMPEDLQSLVTGLARRVAWGGDRRRGSARIELSEGILAGATLVVHTERRTVSVELELPPGAVDHGWQQRITSRLERRGFATQVTVG